MGDTKKEESETEFLENSFLLKTVGYSFVEKL